MVSQVVLWHWNGTDILTKIDLPVRLRDNQKVKFGDGSDAAIYYDATDLNIDPKEAGSGTIKFGVAHTTLSGETVSGYMTFKDSGGTSRKVAVVS